MAAVIEIEDMITVGTLAEKLKLPVSRIITELMKSGIMATVNERIDFDTAQIIVDELQLDITLQQKAAEQVVPTREKRAASKNATERPPVVAVMGHVDHGKTSLLDAIRGAGVAKGEAGGITQHISAYQIEHNKRAITFLDTPGHEAFAAIREHGALLTDIVVLVVAADDGIKPQTVEAIRFARKAGVKIIVAANKMDKASEEDLNRLHSQLSEHELMWDGWKGGDTPVVPVSAKTEQGIPDLLDMVLLVSDVEELKADIEGPATGLIIEAHVEHGRGPMARALVESGTLKQGDYIVAGGVYAKIRTMENSKGQRIVKATPSTPVVLTGFRTLPEFGDEFTSVATEKLARTQAEKVAMARRSQGSAQNMSGSELIRIINRINTLQELNVILKADVQGSLTSVADSLKALATDEVAVRIVSSGVGVINESDLHLAHTSGAIIYGFNTEAPSNVRQLAMRDKVNIRLYKIIYDLIDDARSELSELLVPQVVETDLGRLIVRGIFKTTKTEVICGGEVTKGTLSLPAYARIFRDNEVIVEEVEVTSLKRGPQDTKEVQEGEMCGLSFATTSRVELQEGDRLELFKRETVARKLQ